MSTPRKLILNGANTSKIRDDLKITYKGKDIMCVVSEIELLILTKEERTEALKQMLIDGNFTEKDMIEIK